MRLIAVVPLVTTPVRLGSAAGAVLAGHPATRLVGWAVWDAATGRATWHAASAGASPPVTETGALLVMPGIELVRRLGATLPHDLMRAEDVCRLWGESSWHATPQAIYAVSATMQARQQVQAICCNLQGRLDQVADLLSPNEWSAYQAHCAINERGLPINMGAVHWLIQVIAQREAVRATAVGTALGTANMTVTEALRPGGPLDRLLARNGLALSSRSEDALLQLLASEQCPPSIAQVLNDLIGHGRIVKAKVESIRAGVDQHGRLRQQFVMWAARTWRFSSQGTQVQNLPKPASTTDYPVLAGIFLDNPLQADGRVPATVLDELVKSAPNGRVDDTFPALLRMCFAAADGNDLIILDWNAIEPRIRAWLSNDQEHLAAWRQGRDLYCELIISIVGRPVTKKSDPSLRNVGKVADIGCGYHMGANSFADLCSSNHIDLNALGLTAAGVVQSYRRKYNALSDRQHGLWARLQDGAIQAVTTGRAAVGPLAFERTARGHLDLILPNGSHRRWWNAAVQMRSPKWVVPGDRSQDRPVVVVASTPDGPVDQVMYGGRILENACQAIGREILADLLVRLHDLGVPVVGHCHDEIVMEVAATESAEVAAAVQDLASAPPTWAHDLPLKAEVFTSPIWSKEDPLHRL